MPRFIVRVELRFKEGTKPNYTALHEAMKVSNFYQQANVDTDTGTSLRVLPYAEYHIEGDVKIDLVARAAKEIADAINTPPKGEQNLILVSEIANVYGIGLQPGTPLKLMLKLKK